MIHRLALGGVGGHGVATNELPVLRGKNPPIIQPDAPGFFNLTHGDELSVQETLSAGVVGVGLQLKPIARRKESSCRLQIVSQSTCLIREARATIVAAAQSTTSFIPPLGREKARVLSLNLRNRMVFRAADEEGANESADFLGKKKVIKKSWGHSGGRRSTNFSEQEEYKIKPHILSGLPKHTAVLVHCDRGLKRTLLPPLEPDGKVSPWFKKHGVF